MLALAPLLWSVVTWLFRSVVLQFILMTIVTLIVTQLMPVVMGFVGSWLNPSGFSALFATLDPGTWYFLDLMALDVGMPIILSACITRFLIRRIPFIG